MENLKELQYLLETNVNYVEVKTGIMFLGILSVYENILHRVCWVD